MKMFKSEKAVILFEIGMTKIILFELGPFPLKQHSAANRANYNYSSTMKNKLTSVQCSNRAVAG